MLLSFVLLRCGAMGVMQLRLGPVLWMIGPALEMSCVLGVVMVMGGKHVGQWGRRYFYGGGGGLIGRTVSAVGVERGV